MSIRIMNRDGVQCYYDPHRSDPWVPIPLDDHGLYTVDFLRSQGVNILSSEVREQRWIAIGAPDHMQKVRVDTIAADTPAPLVTFFYPQTQGDNGIYPIN